MSTSPLPQLPSRPRSARLSTTALLLAARQMDWLEASRAPRNMQRHRVLLLIAFLAISIVAFGMLLANSSGVLPLMPEPEPLTVVMFTNREAPALAVINTVFYHAHTPGASAPPNAATARAAGRTAARRLPAAARAPRRLARVVRPSQRRARRALAPGAPSSARLGGCGGLSARGS
jgi:hypothetical protein